MFSKVIAISALAACASAHMIMDYPKPFGRSTLTSSPLAPADFPCKQRNGVYAIDTMNQWDAGQTKTVSFNGTAVHGGGSCQFSITTDAEPTVNSQWKVIQSNIGNCPSDAPANLDENPKLEPNLTPDNSTFPVTMPKNIPDGRYTFAWTWINKVGQREFYMNCAPVQVGSSSGKASTTSAAQALSALPDMFVANLPNDQCATKEREDFVYPNPGQNVVKGTAGVTFGSTLTGSGCTKMNAMGAGAGQIGSPSAGTPSTPEQGTPSKPSSAPAKSAAPSASPINKGPAESPAPINPGGVFAPGASSAPASGPTAQPKPPVAQPTVPAAKPVPSAAPPATPQVPNNTTPSNGECTPCTNDGAVVCIGSNQFGLCNRGCAVAQDLAAGMACSKGVVVASTKRHLHFPRAHLHRRLSAAHML
jgi:hypothetical protein